MKSHLKKLASPLLFLILGYVGVALMVWYTGNLSAPEPEQQTAEEELILLQPKAEYLVPEVPAARKSSLLPAPRRRSQETVAVVTPAPQPEVPVAKETPVPLPPRHSKREAVAVVNPTLRPEVQLDQDSVKTLVAQAAVDKFVAEKDSSIQSVADSGEIAIGKAAAAGVAPGRTPELRLSMDQEKIYDDILIMLRQKLAAAQVKEADRIPPAAGEVVLASSSNMMPVLGVKPAAAGFRRHGIRVAAAQLYSLTNPANGGPGGKIGYSFRDNARISINLDLGITPLVLNKSRLSMVTGDVYGQLHFRNSRRLQPTLSLGFGTNRLQAGAFAKPQIVGSVCAGGGMDYKLSDTISLNTSVQYRQLLSEIKVASGAPRDGFVSVQAGLSVLFGGSKDSSISIDNSLMADNK